MLETHTNKRELENNFTFQTDNEHELARKSGHIDNYHIKRIRMINSSLDIPIYTKEEFDRIMRNITTLGVENYTIYNAEHYYDKEENI